ncbi:hypothetical protein UA45_22925 [Morganella morganii]|uniref:Uncharacterized protein n=1 Tax=Morganella morganii TaxID=582 RepID=A0A0D8L144_MORMO|nr:hypothetical protein UA45_22925 [Morganella morganii]
MNVTMDMAKLVISMKIGAVAVTGLMTLASIASGSVIVVSAVTFGAGLIIAAGLYAADDYFGISESIIRELKKQRKPRSDSEGRYHADTFFTNFHRFG